MLKKRLFLSLILLIAITNQNPFYNEIQITPQPGLKSSNWVEISDLVVIGGDLDWQKYTWISGNGSSWNPYLIQNKIFIAVDGIRSILLYNTRLYCNIQNCSFLGDFNRSKYYSGIGAIELDNCSNIQVNNCDFDQLPTSISIYSSANVVFENNNVNNCSQGIEIWNGSSVRITNNSIANSLITGISSGSVYSFCWVTQNSCGGSYSPPERNFDITIEKNNISLSPFGITLMNAEDIYLQYNQITQNQEGIILWDVKNVTSYMDIFRENGVGLYFITEKNENIKFQYSIIDTIQYGAIFERTTNVELNNVTIQNCSNDGIYIYRSNSNLIKNCTFKDIEGFDIALYDSRDIDILGNQFSQKKAINITDDCINIRLDFNTFGIKSIHNNLFLFIGIFIGGVIGIIEITRKKSIHYNSKT